MSMGESRVGVNIIPGRDDMTSWGGIYDYANRGEGWGRTNLKGKDSNACQYQPVLKSIPDIG